MAAKQCVHEIAFDLGVERTVTLAKLREPGELVKSPSSSDSSAAAGRRFYYLRQD
jgi:hypothetical protein